MRNLYAETENLRKQFGHKASVIPMPIQSVETNPTEFKFHHIANEDLTVDPFALFAARMSQT